MSNPDNVSILRPGSAASRGGRRSRIEDPSQILKIQTAASKLQKEVIVEDES